MKSSKTFLKPVKPEDYKLKLGANIDIATITPEEAFGVTINQFKKLAVGTYFWFIADAVNGLFHSGGGMVDKIVPLTEKDLENNSPEILFRNTHPEDIVQMFAFTNYWTSFYQQLELERRPHVRATIYLRLLNPQKVYKWVMVQYADTLTNNKGEILYGLTLVTDISHIKKDGPAMMSVLDAFDDSCQLFYCQEGKTMVAADLPLVSITKREIEVLQLLAIGYSSKQIASELKLALKTIDNHRQNMLRKTFTKSTGELVAYGINKGYI